MIAVERLDGVDKDGKKVWTKIANTLGEAIPAQQIVCDTFRVVYEASDLCHTHTKTDLDTSYLSLIHISEPTRPY